MYGRNNTKTDNIMNSGNVTAIMIYVMAFFVLPTFAQPYSGLSGFSAAFIRDYVAAEQMVGSSKSAKPLIALQDRYTNEVEQAELEVTLGFLFSMRTGVVDPSNAVVHLTAALGYNLPEETLLKIFMYRGSSMEQLKQQ